MPKILVAECKQEVATFNPVLSHIDDFELAVGDTMLAAHDGVRSEVAGALAVFRRHGSVQVVPGYSARAITSGGPLAAEDFERLSHAFLTEVRTHRTDGLDGVLFCMHGAMEAENELDPEGHLLAEARTILGEAIPLVVSLDLHGVLSDRMLSHADAVVAYHTYPHVDFYETGERAADLLLAIIEGAAKPVTARVAIPALVRGDELITETGLLGDLIREAKRIEADDRGLSAGMFIGNPFTDVPELGSSSVVVTDGDEQLAAREALALAQSFWRVRHKLQAYLVSLQEMVRLVSSHKGTVILTDAADATSSGASGDSNAILAALHDAGYRGRVLAPIVDAPAVEAAHAAGVGAKIDVAIGGTLDPERFVPMPITAQVRTLSDGAFQSESHSGMWHAGPTAVLEWKSVTLVVTTRPVSLYDRSLFLAHGQDPRAFDVVVVKSPHCQPRFYSEWAERVVNVDAPGSTSANLPSLGHTRCRRPMFPLDEGADFHPRAQIFRRTQATPKSGLTKE